MVNHREAQGALSVERGARLMEQEASRRASVFLLLAQPKKLSWTPTLALAKRLFFNSVVAAYTGWNDGRNVGSKAVMLGDGSFVGDEEMADAQVIMADIEVAFPWQQGDVLLLDNRTVLHSRHQFCQWRGISAEKLLNIHGVL